MPTPTPIARLLLESSVLLASAVGDAAIEMVEGTSEVELVEDVVVVELADDASGVELVEEDVVKLIEELSSGVVM